MALLDFVKPCVGMLDCLVTVLATSHADGDNGGSEKKRADSVVSASPDGDSTGSVLLQSPEEEAQRKRRHTVTSSSLSIRLLDGGVGEAFDRSDYGRLLSFSNDHVVVMVTGADDDTARDDAVASVYRVASTLLLFFQTASNHRSVGRRTEP